MRSLTIAFTSADDSAPTQSHQKLERGLQRQSLEEVLEQAERFARERYLPALFQGDSLPDEERRQIVSELASYTGLSANYIERVNLRPVIFDFAAKLLREERAVIGRLDSRYTGLLRDRNVDRMPYDPSGEAIFSAYASTFHDYVRGELGVETDRPYEILTGNVWPWDWGENNGYVNVAETLADALAQQSFLQVHISNGYYDLATPYWAAEYTVDHMNRPPQARDRVHVDYFAAGHKMYLALPELKKQKAALRDFIRSASGGE